MLHIDMFATIDEDFFIPPMKIWSNNTWFNPDINAYPKGIQMLGQCVNESILHPTLSTSFSIPM